MVPSLVLSAVEGLIDSSINLLIAGDVNINDHLKPNNMSFVWDGVRELIRDSDAFLVNHEGSVTNRTRNVSYPYLKETPAVAESYVKINTTFLALANNHQSDFGRTNPLDTMAFFDHAGLAYAGIGRTWDETAKAAVVNVKGRRIAIFATIIGPYYDKGGRGQSCYPPIQCPAPGPGPLPGVHFVPNVTYAAQELLHLAEKIRSRVDYTIMFFHWGANWDWMDGSSGDIWKDRQWLARTLLDSSAIDLVWGTSAHHIQPVEFYNDKPIIYSTGNLLIPLPLGLPPGIPPPEYRTRLAFLFKLTLPSKHENPSIQALPIVSDDWKIDQLTNTTDRKWLREKYDNISRAFGSVIEERENGDWFIVPK